MRESTGAVAQEKYPLSCITFGDEPQSTIAIAPKTEELNSGAHQLLGVRTYAPELRYCLVSFTVSLEQN